MNICIHLMTLYKKNWHRSIKQFMTGVCTWSVPVFSLMLSPKTFLTWSMPVFSLMLASGGLFGGLAVGLASSEFLFPPNFPAPTTKVLNWLNANFSFFSSNVSTKRKEVRIQWEKYKIQRNLKTLPKMIYRFYVSNTAMCSSGIFLQFICSNF